MGFINWCRTHIRLIVTEGVLLVLLFALTIYGGHIKETQYSQTEAERWAKDGTEYHQVSAFLQQDCGIFTEQISEIRGNLQTSLLEAAFSEDSTTGRLWIDAYMAKTQDSISKETEMGNASVDTVQIVGVGGDFFQFHSLNLLTGSVFSEEDVSLDRIILDEETAWALYGGNDIVGKTVYVAGSEFTIAGVYRKNNDKAENMARGQESYLFIPYDTFHLLYPHLGVVSYEAVLPNPVKGYALSILKKAFGASDEEAFSGGIYPNFEKQEYLDNTVRFHTTSLLKGMRYRSRLMMRTNEISYPYWENAVRLVEVKLTRIILLKGVLFLFFFAVLIWEIRQHISLRELLEMRKNLTKLVKQLIIERLRHILKGRLTGRERKVFEKREFRSNNTDTDRDSTDSSAEI